MARRAKNANIHTVETVVRRLEDDGLEILEVRPIERGNQVRLAGGGNVNVYETGTALPQGPYADALAALLREWPEDGLHPIPPEHRTQRPASFVTTPAMILRMLASLPHDPDHVPYVNPAWSDAPCDPASVPF